MVHYHSNKGTDRGTYRATGGVTDIQTDRGSDRNTDNGAYRGVDGATVTDSEVKQGSTVRRTEIKTEEQTYKGTEVPRDRHRCRGIQIRTEVQPSVQRDSQRCRQ